MNNILLFFIIINKKQDYSKSEVLVNKKNNYILTNINDIMKYI